MPGNESGLAEILSRSLYATRDGNLTAFRAEGCNCGPYVKNVKVMLLRDQSVIIVVPDGCIYVIQVHSGKPVFST